jgi:metallo-beta-lactamase class B
MARRIRLGAALALLAALGCGALLKAQTAQVGQPKNSPPTESLPPQVQQHVDAAYLIMNGDVSDLRLPQVLSSVFIYPQSPASISPQANNSPEGRMVRTTAPPTKAFDQLYYFGMNLVGSWALVTSDGIIQFDALDNTDEAKNIIEAGYKKMGLDPAKMKYLVITHAHGDHYGGAKYLVDTYHPRVLMSAADWEMMAKHPSNNPDWGPAPARDMDVTDGEKLTLGDTTVTLYITPGHTPGTVSALIPVTDHGQKHLLSFLGGAGFPLNLDPSPLNGGLRAYHDSIVRFARIGEEAGVDGIIANHPVSDYTYIDGVHDKVTRMRNRKPGEPNPWIVGQSTYIRYMGATLEALEAAEAMAEIRAQAKTAQKGN